VLATGGQAIESYQRYSCSDTTVQSMQDSPMS
jgi:hypothetical protein